MGNFTCRNYSWTGAVCTALERISDARFAVFASHRRTHDRGMRRTCGAVVNTCVTRAHLESGVGGV